MPNASHGRLMSTIATCAGSTARALQPSAVATTLNSSTTDARMFTNACNTDIFNANSIVISSPPTGPLHSEKRLDVVYISAAHACRNVSRATLDCEEHIKHG